MKWRWHELESEDRWFPSFMGIVIYGVSPIGEMPEVMDKPRPYDYDPENRCRQCGKPIARGDIVEGYIYIDDDENEIWISEDHALRWCPVCEVYWPEELP